MRKLPFGRGPVLETHQVSGGWVQFAEGLFYDHHRRFLEIAASLPLQVERIVVYGQSHLTPRLTSWHGDAGYTYSGRSFNPEPWTEELAAIRDRLKELTGTEFNSVLANYYRSGNDTVGAHSDDEPELGPEPDDVRIASVSLGDRRRFVLKHKETGAKMEFSLGYGNVLVMGGKLQQHWKHSVPRTKKAVGPRLNLTFRVICPT